MKPEKIATLNLEEVEIENDTLQLHFNKKKKELEIASQKIKTLNNNMFLSKSEVSKLIVVEQTTVLKLEIILRLLKEKLVLLASRKMRLNPNHEMAKVSIFITDTLCETKNTIKPIRPLFCRHCFRMKAKCTTTEILSMI